MTVIIRKEKNLIQRKTFLSYFLILDARASNKIFTSAQHSLSVSLSLK